MNFDEESVIKYYFSRGFGYDEIIHLLKKRHNHQISYSTLLRRMKAYGLSRRNFSTREDYDDMLQKVRSRVSEIINGPGSCGGYRTVWHSLEMEGIRVPRVVVQDVLKELDPEGTESRKAKCLKRRKYHNPGPNYAWHQDGYDKLKTWGFPIHGAIDGFSRKILWLEVTRSNNSPDNIATYYLNMVNELKGCPVELVTDLGTENGLAASIQSYFRDNPDAHRYVASPRNQRIEGWWSFYGKHRSKWWRNFFGDLEFQGALDLTSELHKECLWYCFSGVLQEDLNHVKEHWNTHVIRRSRHDTIPGRPDSLFYLPEYNGGVPDLMIPLQQQEIDYIKQHIVRNNYVNEYQEYFDYARRFLTSSGIADWQEAQQLYFNLLDVAENGC